MFVFVRVSDEHERLDGGFVEENGEMRMNGCEDGLVDGMARKWGY